MTKAARFLGRLFSFACLFFTHSEALRSIDTRHARSSVEQVSPFLLAVSGNKYSGGRDRDRTCDLMLAKHALSQLSYTPTLPLFSITWRIAATTIAATCVAAGNPGGSGTILWLTLRALLAFALRYTSSDECES
jgi:hypothetical protein